MSAHERRGRGIHRGSPRFLWLGQLYGEGWGDFRNKRSSNHAWNRRTDSIVTQDFPQFLWQEQKCLGLIKHRNRIETQKSIWNSQVSLPAVTPFPRLGGKHTSEHIHLSSWGWIPHGCSDFLQADKGKGNHTFPWPPTVSFLLLCFVSWNGDQFSCNTQSPEEHSLFTYGWAVHRV